MGLRTGSSGLKEKGNVRERIEGTLKKREIGSNAPREP
jgi:hypothetical protein